MLGSALGLQGTLMSRIAVLIVAAGKGERAGLGLPKQYERLAGLPMLRRTVQAFRGYPVQVVIGAGQQDLAAAALVGLDLPPSVTGGATRHESLRLRPQSPQGCGYAKSRAGHRDHAKEDVSDDVALADLAGLKVQMVEGDEKNIKVSRKEDVGLAESLLVSGDARTATGYDVHKFKDGDH